MADKTSPTLESITIRAKYKVPVTDFTTVKQYLIKTLKPCWCSFYEIGNSIELVQLDFSQDQEWEETIKGSRKGLPWYISVIEIENEIGSSLLEVECRSVMWYRIAQYYETEHTFNEIQEALIECGSFVKQVMSGLKGKIVEPVGVYPVIPKTEVTTRLSNLGLKETVEHLNKAERHIAQNNFEESLKSSRTAFEKTIDWEIKKRGLEKTNNYKNDLERLSSKGYIDSITAELIQSYYKCLSNIAVHAKGEKEAGFYEAKMGFGITLIVLQYFADKLP